MCEKPESSSQQCASAGKGYISRCEPWQSIDLARASQRDKEGERQREQGPGLDAVPLSDTFMHFSAAAPAEREGGGLAHKEERRGVEREAMVAVGGI